MVDNLLTPDPTLLNDDDLFIKPVKKHKILVLSDHPLAPSGVGVQTRILIDGLIQTGKYSFRCLGGAIQHKDYETVQVNPDFIIKPVDGFGTKELIRQLLITERPDALLIFTDPRQFIWLWEIEDEIHQICPITYWHVWDNDPYPKFNEVWYESTELINCLSRKTYDLVKPNYPEKTHYIPHAFPKQMYGPLTQEQVQPAMEQSFAEKANWFKALWVNRNATRKLPSDVLVSWKLFLDQLEKETGKKEALLILHTDPKDREGPDLLAVVHELGLKDHVWFSTEKLSFSDMNLLHNIADCVVNVAKNEGFGLSTLISLQVGKPIIALKTGGETSKAVDYRDGSTFGVALDPIKRSLVGSQLVPYIYEDFVSTEELAQAFRTVHDYTPEEKVTMKAKCLEFVDHAFNIDDVIAKWDRTLEETITAYKEEKKHRWVCEPVLPYAKKENKEAEPTETKKPKKVMKKKKSTGRKAKVVKATL